MRPTVNYSSLLETWDEMRDHSEGKREQSQTIFLVKVSKFEMHQRRCYCPPLITETQMNYNADSELNQLMCPKTHVIVRERDHG